MTDPFPLIRQKATSVFTPGSPVNERDLFAGRIEQLDKIMTAARMRGYHAILYGERGVGKTSLTNIISSSLDANSGWLAPRVNCDGTDTFTSLWRKALQDVVFAKRKMTPGFAGRVETTYKALIDDLPHTLSPDDVRRVLIELSSDQTLLIAFDEFDRLADKHITVLMSDTVKMLSDYAIDATILLVGVADSVDDLIQGHQSIERALIQIPMPRMSAEEIETIIKNGLSRLEMTIGRTALSEIIQLSQGLPYITHLLSLHSVLCTLSRKSMTVTSEDVGAGIKEALRTWQQSVTRSYSEAVRSSQPGNIYKEVLLACSLAETDELGFFNAAAVRTPLQMITERAYDIPNFAQHLKNFGDDGRGGLIERTGEKRRIRYRFTSPLIRPYIIMRGFDDEMITRDQMKELSLAASNKRSLF